MTKSLTLGVLKIKDMSKKIRPKRILAGFKTLLFENETVVAKDRLQTCLECPLLSIGLCTECGCATTVKTKVLEEYCPKNNWEGTAVLKQAGVALMGHDDDIIVTSDEDLNNLGFTVEIKEEIGFKKPYIVKLRIVNDRGNFNGFKKYEDLKRISINGDCSCTIPKGVQKELKEGNYFDFEVKYSAPHIGQFSKKMSFNSIQTNFGIKLKGVVEG